MEVWHRTEHFTCEGVRYNDLSARFPAEPTIGHNGLDKANVRTLVERIEAIESEHASLAEDVRSMYHQAKSNEFDVAALRQTIKMRKQDHANATRGRPNRLV